MGILNTIFGDHQKIEKPLPTYTINELKQVVKVLFVDDTEVTKAEQLRDQEGWRNVVKIDDVRALSQREVEEANIIFVDIQGVGKQMGFKDEGLGLIIALKEQYPEKKVVMYSGETQGSVDAFHKAADIVDGRLRKGADLYEFSSLTEKLAKEAFCFDNCVRHICTVLRTELKVDKSQAEVEEIVKRIYNDDLYTEESSIAEAFSLSNIGSVASIIQLLLCK